MKEKENILSIKKRLEPSSELKRRVMERAKELEAGKKTFGIEMTTADNTEINKEPIKMNAYNINDTAKIKKRFPIAVISAAACAAIVIGLAAVSLKDNKLKTLPTTDKTTDQDSSTSSGNTSLPSGFGGGGGYEVSKDTLAIYYDNGREFDKGIEDVPAINALVEKVMECPVLNGPDLPAERTIAYYVDEEERIVELCDERYPVKGSDYSAGTDEDLFLVIKVNGVQYGVDYNDPTLLLDLKAATECGSTTYEKKGSSPFVAEYNEEAETALTEFIADIRKNGTLLSGEESLPSADCDRSLSYCQDNKCYKIRVWDEADILEVQAYGLIGEEPHSAVYGNARKWIDRLDEIISMFEEDTEVMNWIWAYNFGDVIGYIRIPGLTNADGTQYVNTPVTQGSDNEYYLDHGWSGDEYEAGNIFADYAAPVTEESRPDNIILYGKSRRDLGSMFTHLIDYNDGTGNRLNNASVIKFATAWEDGLQQYPIIGVAVLDTNSGDYFDYSGYSYFDNKHTFDSWMNSIKDNCTIMRDLDCNADDEYLTLSTNIDDENADGYRLVVFARKMRDGETFPAGRFSVNKESPIEIKPLEEVRMPNITGMTEEQAIAALEEAGLGHNIEYLFSNEPKGTVMDHHAPYYLPDYVQSPEGDLVSKGASIEMSVSGGTDLSLYTDPNGGEGELVALTIPLPEGLSGSFRFDARDIDEPYGGFDSVNEIKGMNEFVIPVQGSGKKTVEVTGTYNGCVYPLSSDIQCFKYATYEVDFDAHTYTLIGAVDTEAPAKAKIKTEEEIAEMKEQEK
ncbi:PASTA domain-containing protein [Ruminococcus albus]|uniref:Sortase, SrtB family n=1 Tax=Ruminococcus albus TaxID=1264 RepID=A0A1I1PFW8_RUMAL|nr:PASTA domain-containing protein [Ruminococcus albus]SFD04950.1 sortase, SrtB family [Ruminococcus albus]